MPKYTFAKPYYNVVDAGNTVATEEAWNVYYEAMPSGGYAIRRRPGYTMYQETLGVGRGLHWSDRQKTLYAVSGQSLYYYPAYNVAPSDLGNIPSSAPAVFAECQQLNPAPPVQYMYVAGGGRLKYLDVANGVVKSLTSLNQFDSTFVAMMNNRMYANNTNSDQDFLVTDVNPVTGLDDILYWDSASNPFGAVLSPDPLMGLYSRFNEVLLWGTRVCEAWQDDGVTPVAPLVGSVAEVGCQAPYSVVFANNTLMGLAYLGGKRAVVSIAGRSPQVLSEPIANRLQAMTYTDDAVGMLCFVGGLNMYVLTFPTENQTWAYDFKTDTWSQWSSWDLDQAKHNAFTGVYGVYARGWNSHLIQSKKGDIYELSRDTYTDNGDVIKSSIRTGWMDHGTWDRKRSDQFILKLKGFNRDDSKILMRWRSDGFPEWSTAIELSIMHGGQDDHYCKLNRGGTYRSRQYEFILTDAADLALVGFEEDLTRLRF